jgi:hypothetical protein
MKKYKVILTESEMQKLKHLVNEKVNDDDVDVNVGGSRLHKNLKKGDNYLKKIIIDLLKSETDFRVRKNRVGDIEIESDTVATDIEFDSDGLILVSFLPKFEDYDIDGIEYLSDDEMKRYSDEKTRRTKIQDRYDDKGKQYDIDDYNDRGRNGLEMLAKTIVSYIEKVMK